MTEQCKWDLKVTLTLVVALALVIGLNLSCGKRCKKNEVKIDGKCYAPGATYLRINGEERML